jgi:hypothetical protein
MSKMKTSLYNSDGSLCTEAQFLLSSKPDDMSMAEWRKILNVFKDKLFPEDLKELKRLKTKKSNAKWRAENPERSKESNAKSIAKWRAENPQHLASYLNNYHKQRKAKDPLYHLQYNMRSLGNRVVKQLALGKKPACTEKWQGCSAEELKARLESLFSEGMSWDNYGEWHVDHIRPVSSFTAEEAMQINHYTNLQPLWAVDNLSKSDKT